MKVNHIKQLFVALFLLLSAGTATAAQWKLAKTNLNAAGSKDTLTLEVSGNSFSFSSFQVDFTLPEGVLMDGTPLLGALPADHALTWSKREDGSFRCVVYSARNSEMKAPEGALILVPVDLTASFKDGDFTAKNGILSNKKSVAQPVTDLSATLMAYKERANLVVNVSGLEQVANPIQAAELAYTTLPAGKSLTVAYYKDMDCKTAATDADRKKEGILYVKLSYGGDVDYAAFEQIYTMSLTSKIAIDASGITAPTAASIKAGQLLSASLLSGGSVTDKDGLTIAGTFAWTDGNTVMPAGTTECSVTFFPDNSSYYNTAELKVKVEVTATYKITAIATTGGTVNVLGKAENNVYVNGQQISLKAIPLPNYQFDGWSVTGSSESLEKKDSISVEANADKTYCANFSPKMCSVTIGKEGNGTISVTVDGAEVASGTSLQQGVVLQVLATPDVNAQLKLLTINGDSLIGDKVTLSSKALAIHAIFEAKPVNMALISIPKATNGSVLLYKEDGSLLASGSTVPVNSKIRAVALPDPGYQLDGKVSLTNITAATDGLCTVTGDVTATATFGPKKYKVVGAAVSSNPSETKPAGKITLEPSGEQPYGTEVSIASIEGQNGARLLTILANGKEISRNEVLTVTGDLTVTAVFDHRVDIKKEYILWPYQEYYYNGVSRNFVPFASQTYAGFSFEVLYRNTAGLETAKAIDADHYTVLLHRDEDGLYNTFDEEYADGLVIKKSKVSVTEAPTNGGNPKTRPSGDEVSIRVEPYNVSGVTKYVIEPKSDAAKKNYEGTVYYHSTKAPKSLSFGTSILRSAEGPTGYVRVTNGGLPYASTDGKVSIPEGITVTLEAVPAEGSKFSKWSDGVTMNPREYTIAEGSTGVTPEFTGKDNPTYALSKTSSVYNGEAQILSVTGEGNEACQITFFFDEACQQPAVLKNAGKYYVRVYRPADATYNEYTNVFSYTIEQAKPEVTWPTASEVLAGHKLAESHLMGGHAGIVAGTFAWKSPGKMMTETAEKEILFTPTDPNYMPVTGMVEVKVVSASSTTTDPETPIVPVDPVDPENPDKPDVPTGVESIEEGMSLYAANQSIFVNMPQTVSLMVSDVAGIVIYKGEIRGKMEIPVGHAGVYLVRCDALGESFVRKVVVR